ncbi:MAG: hypothetical protein AB7D47_09820 [Desulfovibrio sp.]
MAKKSKADRDNIERLESIAFWLWQYTSRNRSYQRFINVITWYRVKFLEVDELENLDEYLGYDNVLKLMDDPEFTYDTLKDNEFTRELSRKHGEFFGRAIFKLVFLMMKFNERFGREPKDYDERMDTDEALGKLLDDQTVTFSSKDKFDQYAVMQLRDEWMLEVEGDSPNPNMIRLEDDDKITIDPKKLTAHKEELSKEAGSFEIYDQISKKASKGGRLNYDTKLQIYELGGAGKHYDPKGDVMRLVMLWLWDKAHEGEEDGNEPKTLDEVLPLLKDRVKTGHLQNISYDAFFRKPRLRSYYQTTEHCINNLTVLPLKSK